MLSSNFLVLLDGIIILSGFCYLLPPQPFPYYNTYLINLDSKVYEAIDNGESYDIIYLNFSKAFDKVPHSRLLKEIRADGVDGNILAWLRDGRQRVVIKGSNSEWDQVISGVPQELVLVT